MPLLDFDNKETWDSLYCASVENQIYHYERAARNYFVGAEGKYLATALENVGLKKNHRIAFIGSGFAWVSEQFVQCGYNDVLNFDTSQWIHANKENNAVLPIIDVNITTPQGIAEIQSYGLIDWIISEDVLPILSDEECGRLCTAMRQISNNVAHWVTPKFIDSKQDKRCNWKFLEDWKTFVASDYVVPRGKDKVL